MAKPSKTTPRSLTPVPKDVRAKAKELFFAHTPINDISKQLQISTAAIARWRTDEKWLEERVVADEALAADIVSSRKLTLVRIAKAGIDEIERAINFVRSSPDPMSIPVAEKMANLISTLVRVQRLDAGESTENVALGVKVAGVSVDKIREVLLNDPYMKEESKSE